MEVAFKDAYSQYVKSSSLEEVLEFWEASDEDIKTIIDYVFLSCECQINHVHWYFYKKHLLIVEASADDMEAAWNTVITQQAKAWQEYESGKEQAIGRLIGALTKAANIDPKTSRSYIESKRKGK